MEIIRILELRKFYGETPGIKGLSFGVEQGEIFGFLGPNGAGKTTTIRLLMNLLHADSGRIHLFGTRIQGNQIELREKIGYLPGEFRPYLQMEGRAFLDYMARYRARPPVLRAYLLEKFRINDQALSQPIKYLSHGNRQKLGIVMALEHEPELAILDEPTLGLDPLMQEAFYEILLEIQRRGKTVFLSSHILSEVEKICHRVAIIRQAELVALETLESLKKKRPRRLILELEDAPRATRIDLPGVRLLAQEGPRCTYWVEGEVQEVLRALANLPVKDIVFPEADLEDVFMAYYQGEKK